MKLNLGCGTDIKQGWVNADHKPGPGVDVVMDATDPFPFDDRQFDEIYTSHLLEHLYNWHEVAIPECHRTLKPGGRLEIRVPYGCSRHNPDAQHVRYFWEGTMGLFIYKESPALDARGLNGLFELESEEVLYMMWHHWHIQKYLGISFFEKCKYRVPLGYKKDMRWILRKPEGDKDA